MIYQPPKYDFLKPTDNPNERLRKLEGVLDDKEAKLTLCEFLRTNLGVTFELLTGFKLAPYQLINLKMTLLRNFSFWVHSRGIGKSFSAAALALMQAILYPNSQIMIVGPNFRAARNVWNYMEKFTNSPGATLIMQAMGKKSKPNDEWSWEVNGGKIIAIPLSGERIRGFRANVLLVDEFLLMTEDIVEKVLMPFLVAPQDISERFKIREKEDELIRKGVIQEKDRVQFKNNSKLVAMSSASYTCEYAYKKYCEILSQIKEEKISDEKSTFYISQLAWNAVPRDMIDQNIIEIASSNEANSAIFAREYGAQFIDGSDSYFSMNKMLKCTIPDGEEPTLLLRGKANKQYILAIDPNGSNSPTADHFAMCIIELNDDLNGGTIVHQYAKAGKDLKDKIKYFHYLVTNFNLVFIIIDNENYDFINAANESEWFKNSRLNLKFFEFKPEVDGNEYLEELKKAKNQYNPTIQKICLRQVFNPYFIRKSNEYLQGCIDYKRIWFGSSIKAINSVFEAQISLPLRADFIDEIVSDGEGRNMQFIDEQDSLIKQTRYEMASIEVKTSIQGNMTFDLPNIMKRDRTVTRMRRDSYTAVLLGNWAIKCYKDILSLPEDKKIIDFEPRWI